MDTAENSAMAAHAEGTLDQNYQYYNSKLLASPGSPFSNQPNGTHQLVLIPNSHFNNIPVNTTLSAVHVPTNVYDRCKSSTRY
jgi:voltage-dependent calcium channel alpha-2/delta-3